MKRLIVLLAALAFPAWAQPGLDPAIAAEAPHYMEATGKVALLNIQIESLRSTVIGLMATSNVPPAGRAAFVDKYIMPDLRAASADLLTQWTNIYVADTSLADMKAAEAFFASPAGQHLLASERQVSLSLHDVTVAWEEKAVHDAFARHETELQGAALLHE